MACTKNGQQIGRMPMNFEVTYQVAGKSVPIKHLLHADRYASSISEEEPAGWVLLGEKAKRKGKGKAAGKAAGKAKATPATPPP